MSSFSENRDDFGFSNDSFDNGMMNDGAFGERNPRSTRMMAVPVILACGFATTVAALVINFLIAAFTDFDPLLITVFYIIPVGAFLVGIVAGCGYGLSARVTQFFPSKRFIVLIVVIQFGIFFASRYAEYRLNILGMADPPGFFEVYKAHLEGFVWHDNGNNKNPVALGKLGYFLEFAASVLFALGALLSMGILHGIPYCRHCRKFMQKSSHFSLPASAKRTKIKKKDAAGKEQLDRENAETFARATGYVEKIVERLQSGENNDAASMVVMLSEIRDQTGALPKEIKKHWHQLMFELSRCSDCGNFSLKMTTAPTNAQEKNVPPLPHAVQVAYCDGTFQKRVGVAENAEPSA